MEKVMSTNPATGEILWEGESASPQMIDAAVAGARKAFAVWGNLLVEERVAIVEKYRDLLTTEKEEFAMTISKETGKPLWETRTEVGAMIGKVAISVEAFSERCPDRRIGSSVTRHRPHGVVAVFGPFNFPGHLPNGHIVPALIAGNTILFKPSPLTPLVAERMVALWDKAGLPEGVLQLLQGGAEAGKHLAGHDGIDGIFFTGSWTTGKILREQLAGKPEKILALEMGGNNPLIIGSIKDVDAAVYLTILSAYLTSGQRCTCARRLIVIENDDFIDKLVEAVKKIKVGSHLEEPFMGPVISVEAASSLLKAQDALGGTPLVKMQLLKENSPFLSPGLIDVTEEENRLDVECFGPLLQLIRVANLDEAIEEANNTVYGLSAGILSDSREEYEQFYRSSRAGIVNWNTQLTGASSAAPFGGIGHSGNHRPSAYYAADYCSYPVASMEEEKLIMPENKLPGI